MEVRKKPRICILFCGGTIMMAPDPKTGALDVSGGIADLLNIEPKLKEIYYMDAIFIDNLDSTNMKPTHWDTLVTKIVENYGKYDGFVVTHGTNTMAYTSSALSFALVGIGKPVVLTGAQIPMNRLESDARQNFVNAVKLASMDLSGVYVVFGSKIILGCRAKKDNERELNAFKTFNSSDMGEIGIQIKLKGDHPLRHSQPFEAKPGFSSDIIVLTLEPGISEKHVEEKMNAGIKGIVLRAFGAGDVPYSLVPTLEQASRRKVPIVVTTQCPNGVTQMSVNMVGLRSLNANVIQAFDMSMESMTTKLRWLLSNNVSYENIKRIMETNLCGEIVSQITNETTNG